jgi:hypothetical protein
VDALSIRQVVDLGHVFEHVVEGHGIGALHATPSGAGNILVVHRMR